LLIPPVSSAIRTEPQFFGSAERKSSKVRFAVIRPEHSPDLGETVRESRLLGHQKISLDVRAVSNSGKNEDVSGDSRFGAVDKRQSISIATLGSPQESCPVPQAGTWD
jgi:hypothetical protein